MFTAEGGAAHWSGFALGQPAGKAPAARLAVCGRFQTSSPKLARLNGVANVVEYEVAEDGSYRWKMWEWKPGQA
jgi:hypothetical protein